MKVFVYGTGDPSVGISPVEATLEVNIDIEDYDDDERIQLRKHLAEFIGDFFDDRIRNVIFEDECPDCLSKLVNEKCIEKYCINNREIDDETIPNLNLDYPEVEG